jgi:hypothetical protein
MASGDRQEVQETSAPALAGAAQDLAPERHVTELILPGGNAIFSIEIVDGSDAEHWALAEYVRELLSARTRPFAIIVDIRRLTHYPASQRRAYAFVRERLREVYERLHVMTAYVSDTDAQRGFLTAVSWTAKASGGGGRQFTSEWQGAYDLCKSALELASPAAV